MRAISEAIDAVGGAPKLAALLNVSVNSVYFWRSGTRSVPVEKMAAIEEVTGGVVRRWDLRPNDWWLIWPELIGAEGAPIMAEEARDA